MEWDRLIVGYVRVQTYGDKRHENSEKKNAHV